MAQFKLEPYQQKIKDDCREGFALGHKWIMVQAPTRSGKTVIFCDIGKDFLVKSYADKLHKDELLILVHDRKIMRQIKKTFYRDHEIVCEEITAKTKSIPPRLSLFNITAKNRVFIAMEKTFSNRIKLKSFAEEMNRIGFIISDEAHLSNFKRIYKLPVFQDTLRLGFSATPISADKKDHLYPTYFTYLVLGPTIQYLIEYNKTNPSRGVVKCVTYVLSDNIDRSQYEIELFSQEDLDRQSGDELSGTRQVKNVVNAYITKSYGKRMLCFNATKDHSKIVTAALCVAGLNARHIDSDCDDEQILEALAWFKKTKGAILCNVNMTATGFDEPACDGVIINKLSKSLSWIKQAEARGGTPNWDEDIKRWKEVHIVLDMCDNTIAGGHGEWHDFVDWKKLFYEPRYSTPGAAPKKECKACGAVNSASARICCVCEEPFDFSKPTIDTVERSMKLISKGIDVAHTIEVFKDRREYDSFYDLIRQTAYAARERIGGDPNYVLEEEDFDDIFIEAQGKLTEWRKIKQKKQLDVDYNSVRTEMQTQLERYGFICNFKDQGDACYAVKKRI